MDLNTLPQYVSHKEVRAARIVSVDDLDSGHVEVQNLVTNERDTVAIENKVFARYTPIVGDYLMVYGDGYLSVSPAAAFEEGYNLKR